MKMLTIMWKARRICGKQIHMYKIFWYFPKPPTVERIWSKFISGGGRGECRSLIGEAVVDGAAVGRRIKQRLLVNTHPTINQLYGAGMRGVGMSRESGEPVPITSNLDIILIPSSRNAQIGFHQNKGSRRSGKSKNN